MKKWFFEKISRGEGLFSFSREISAGLSTLGNFPRRPSAAPLGGSQRARVSSRIPKKFALMRPRGCNGLHAICKCVGQVAFQRFLRVPPVTTLPPLSSPRSFLRPRSFTLAEWIFQNRFNVDSAFGRVERGDREYLSQHQYYYYYCTAKSNNERKKGSVSLRKL